MAANRCRQDARQAGQIGLDLDLAPSGVQHRAHGVYRIVAEFEQQPAAGSQHARGASGDQALVDFEAGRPGEERDLRLVVADFALECWLVGSRDIGRVRDQHVDAAIGEARDQVAGEKLTVRVELAGIFGGDAQRRGRDVGGENARAGFERQRDGDRARACADVQHHVAGLDARRGSLPPVLGFGAGNQDVRRHAELAAVEFLAAGDVLRRLALQALVQVAAVVDPGRSRSVLLRDGRRDSALAVESVGQQNFGGQAGGGDGVFFEELGALEQSGLDGHGSNSVHTSVDAARRSACATVTRLRPGLSASRSDSMCQRVRSEGPAGLP